MKQLSRINDVFSIANSAVDLVKKLFVRTHPPTYPPGGDIK